MHESARLKHVQPRPFYIFQAPRTTHLIDRLTPDPRPILHRALVRSIACLKSSVYKAGGSLLPWFSLIAPVNIHNKQTENKRGCTRERPSAPRAFQKKKRIAHPLTPTLLCSNSHSTVPGLLQPDLSLDSIFLVLPSSCRRRAQSRSGRCVRTASRGPRWAGRPPGAGARPPRWPRARGGGCRPRA